MKKQDGFTLIEALITTLVLVTGLTAVAAAFSYSSLTASRVAMETAAIALVSGKMEDLKMTQEVTPGNHSEYLDVTNGGNIVATEPGPARYVRTCEITSEVPARITVVVYGRSASRRDPLRELARATTLRAHRF
ncbi:MAG TPA: prepilin-type N-terminal cleavage/methylation domain-containing protein [Terriglobia bacterium]|nr:prepilin-type N-terminal cleavage/methylation domain-containing protein [Terriglobia bacterium]